MRGDIILEKSSSAALEGVIQQYKEKQAWHVRLVSIGGFFLLAGLSIFIIDFFISVLVSLIASSLLLDVVGIAIIRIFGFGLFAVCMYLTYRGLLFHTQRVNHILNAALLLGIVILITFLFSVGVGLITAFFFFLWTPKFTENWTPRQLHLYRIIILLAIIVIMGLELFLTEEITGIDLMPEVFVPSLNSRLDVAGLGFLSIFTIVIMIPLYMLLPKVVVSLWGFRSNIESFWKEFLHERIGIIGLIIVGGIIVIAIAAPVLAPKRYDDGSLQIQDLLNPPWYWDESTRWFYYNETTQSFGANPRGSGWLGTNHRGEDIYSRLIYGAQISLLVAITAAVFAVFIGTAVGLISGYYGGLLDTILMRITDVFLCLPVLPLMLIFLLYLGQGLQNVILVIAILGWTGTARMVRSEALSLRERPLTEAAHALGATDMYILIHHILPNTLPLILANVILGVVNAILSEAGIAFLGFVDIHGQPSWGVLLHWASKNGALLNDRWWWLIPPGLFILLTTLGFVFVSHAADKVVNPRLRGRRG